MLLMIVLCAVCGVRYIQCSILHYACLQWYFPSTIEIINRILICISLHHRQHGDEHKWRPCDTLSIHYIDWIFVWNEFIKFSAFGFELKWEKHRRYALLSPVCVCIWCDKFQIHFISFQFNIYNRFDGS